MLQKKSIFSTSLQEYRPIIWYGEPVFVRYTQLKAILAEKLGEKFANILSEPIAGPEVIEGKGRAHWMSDYVSNPVPFTKLDPQKQEQARQSLSLIINKIKGFAKELEASEDLNQKQLGELLLLSTEVPGLDYIFVEDDKITLVLWGFTSEEAKKSNFLISKVIEAPILPKPPETKVIQDEIKTDDKIPLEKKLDDSKEVKTVQTKQEQIPPVIAPPIPPAKEKKGMPGWLWFLIGALLMFLILFLIWWFFLRAHPLLPEHSNIMPPVDTTKLVTDPKDPAKRKVFSNKFNVALKKKADIKKFAEDLNKKYKDNLEIVYFDTVINLLQIQTPEGKWREWMDSVRKMPDTRLVFSESLFERSEKPNDPAFSDAKKSWYFDPIGVYKAWDITKGSPDIVVAVIDNGFDLQHPEFKDKIVKPWNVFTHSNEVFPVPVQGGQHGTHVAGSAIGLANNGEGLCGIAPLCKFMPIQVADKNGNMTSLAVVAGLLYAINQGAQVVNMSLGMMFPPEVATLPEQQQKVLADTLYRDEAIFWNELYLFGIENKMVIVQAAGNDNILAGIDPAARSRNTIVVSAVGPGIKKADFSNWGDLTVISAPGVEIFSSVPHGGYEFLQGTSMASPIVAGAVALMKSKYPNISPEKLIKIFVKTAIPVASDQYIAPLIQIDKALMADTSKIDSAMVIPKNPKDLTFAEGRWKSSNDLVSTIDKKHVQLFFDISKSGNGKLTLVEENGTKCAADIKVSFETGRLIMDQLGNAQCPNNRYYYPYQFECVQGSNNEADCTAKQKDSNSDVIHFKLYKQL